MDSLLFLSWFFRNERTHTFLSLLQLPFLWRCIQEDIRNDISYLCHSHVLCSVRCSSVSLTLRLIWSVSLHLRLENDTFLCHLSFPFPFFVRSCLILQSFSLENDPWETHWLESPFSFPFPFDCRSNRIRDFSTSRSRVEKWFSRIFCYRRRVFNPFNSVWLLRSDFWHVSCS